MNHYSETDAFFPQMLADYRAWQKTLGGVDMVALRDELSVKLTNYPYCCKTYAYAPYEHIMLELKWTFVAYKVAQQQQQQQLQQQQQGHNLMVVAFGDAATPPLEKQQ
jgi:hypothetical protein